MKVTKYRSQTLGKKQKVSESKETEMMKIKSEVIELKTNRTNKKVPLKKVNKADLIIAKEKA